MQQARAKAGGETEDKAMTYEMAPVQILQSSGSARTQPISQLRHQCSCLRIALRCLDRLLCVGLLKGAVCFMVDLLRHLTVPYEMDFMVLSSYGNKTSSSGTVKLKKDLGVNPEGRHLLIVEDLIDTGGTLKWLKEYLSEKRAASVRIACLLNKSAGRRADLRDLKVDFVGDECPDEFVVGYGMDFAGEYRCMPFVGVLKKSAYA